MKTYFVTPGSKKSAVSSSAKRIVVPMASEPLKMVAMTTEDKQIKISHILTV